MAASTGFGNLSNISAKLQTAANQPLPQKCKEIDNVLRNNNSKDLQNVIPWLLESIFGFGSEPGWGLDLITKQQSPHDFDAVMRLLGPEGPLLNLIYHMQGDPYLTYEFPFSSLPSPTRHTLEEGNMPLFYVNKIQYQNYSKPVLVLSAFEYYMFHFFYTLVNPQSPSRSVNWSNVTDILYVCLLDEYLKHFMPLNKKKMPKFPQSQSSPVRTPVIHQTSFISDRHTPVSTRTSTRKRASLGLLKSNLMSPQKPLSQNSPVSDKAEIWWTETFVQVLAEFWLNQNSLETDRSVTAQSMMSSSWYGDSAGLDPLSKLFERFSPSNNHIRLMRLVIKHIHTFIDSASPEIIASPYQSTDSSPLDDFKRSLIPQVLQKKIYTFLKHSFERWPLDHSFRLVLEMWLTYIQPWRYPDESQHRPPDMDSKDQVHDIWFPFVRDNFLFYIVLFQEFLQRTKRMNLTSLHDAYMVFRVAKVFSLPNLPQLLREAEKVMHNCGFKSAQQDLSGSYIAPEMSMVLRIQISDLERPDFTFLPFFGMEMKEEIQQLLNQISVAKSTIQSATPEKKQQKSGFASFFNMSLFEDNTKAYGDLNSSEVKKLVGHLEQAFTDMCRVFGIPLSQVQSNQTVPLSPGQFPGYDLQMSSNQSILNQSGLPSIPSTPDCHQTEYGPQLTPLGRYQVMNGMRKFQTFYAGDPDLQPIRSFENTTLVRLFHRVSSFINRQFKREISSAYHRKDFIGKMSQVYFAAPLKPGESPKSPVTREVSECLHQPRLSLRFLANYQTLLYLGLVYIGLHLGWGVGTLGYLLFLILCVLVFGIFRAIVHTDETPVDRY